MLLPGFPTFVSMNRISGKRISTEGQRKYYDLGFLFYLNEQNLCLEDDHILKRIDNFTTWVSSVVSLKRISGRRPSTDGKGYLDNITGELTSSPHLNNELFKKTDLSKNTKFRFDEDCVPSFRV